MISDVVIPNAFSPNFDGLNDYFTIPDLGDICESINYFTIYDRWGKLVFEWAGDGGTPGWDGTHNVTGADLHIGNYIYLIELECENGKRLFSGEVLLLR